MKEAVRLSHAAFHEEDMFADLPKIACPTLLVYAGQGGVITDADAIEVVSLLKGASKIKIDHVAHVLPFEDLDAFVAVVQPFHYEGMMTGKRSSQPHPSHAYVHEPNLAACIRGIDDALAHAGDECVRPQVDNWRIVDDEGGGLVQ